MSSEALQFGKINPDLFAEKMPDDSSLSIEWQWSLEDTVEMRKAY